MLRLFMKSLNYIDLHANKNHIAERGWCKFKGRNNQHADKLIHNAELFSNK